MRRLATFLMAACVVAVTQQPARSAMMTTPSQSGIVITTTIDLDNHMVVFDFDLTALPYDYEQIAFTPSPLPAFTAIPLVYGAVTSPGQTEVNFHPLYDAQSHLIGWQLEVQYMTAGAPPRLNDVTINYNPQAEVTGGFVQPDGNNVTITYREPDGGFPDGQDDNIEVWAYVPQIIPEPISVSAWSMGGLWLLLRRR